MIHRSAGKRGRIIGLALSLSLAGLFLASCSSRVPPPPREPLTGQTGIASWYGGKFHGRTTANGETYDKHGMTAAHRTLPFDTIVKVTNLANGKSVRLRINDRGPFVKGRIIDVSRRAAEELDFRIKGITRVRLEVVSTP